MSIPLPRMLRDLRMREFERRLTPARARWALAAWAYLAKRPRLYQSLSALGMRVLALMGRPRGALRRLPLAGGWTAVRDMPAPQGETFQRAWRRRRAADGRSSNESREP